MRRSPLLLRAALCALLLAPAASRAAEHVVLRNGFELDCARQETIGQNVRLYLLPSSDRASTEANYIEVSATSIASTVAIPDPPPAAARPAPASLTSAQQPLSTAGMHQLLARAGSAHNLDADLLAAVVQAESAGRVHAVSRAGAEGLMQLMPATATSLGVADAFAPDQNIAGGTTYLDQLLTRYHDDITLALAAYNAGPAAVDRYHGVPPFAETRAYVARIIREFNRRKRLELAARSANPLTPAR